MRHRPLLIGVVGGSGSGKTTVARAIYDFLGQDAAFIDQDAYYLDLSHLSLDERFANAAAVVLLTHSVSGGRDVVWREGEEKRTRANNKELGRERERARACGARFERESAACGP